MNTKSEKGLAKPTPEQIEWADCEVGVIIHYDIQVFYPSYDFRKQRGWHPEPTVFNPTQLDTDQWIEAAKAAGAKYAVLVAKHCSGFCLWPTEAHDYSVKSSPWKNGKGDIVADFIASCEKYDIRPGLYYSSVCNAYCDVDNPGKVLSGDPEEQKRYNEIVIQQLTEIWSNYGKLLEIWFDGGVLPPEQGGPDIPALLWKLQPQAVVFQGPKGTPSLLRWVGNERGEAPYPCWSTTNMKTGNITGGAECPEAGAGDPGGAIWAPAESDMPNRNHRWFWVEGEDHLLYSVNELVERYYLSVGRNTNLLLGMVIDDRGLVPDADVKQFTEFGAEVRRRFSRNLAEVSGEGDEVILNLGQPTMVDSVITMEDIAKGERVREYVIDGLVDGEWTEICKGISIGHKRINCFEPVEVSKVKLRCTKSVAMPIIRRLAVYLFPQNTQS